MRILLVNGSPRRGAASSRVVLDALRKRLGEGHEYRMVETMAGQAKAEELDVDFIVLAFPLYIDSLHSRLLAWLESFEELRRGEGESRLGSKKVGMIAVANCGFHEGIQNKTALDIVANFCARSGIEWRGALGIGTGEMLKELRDAPDDMFIKRPVSRALDAIAARVGRIAPSAGDASQPGGEARAQSGNLYASHAFSWLIFKTVAHFGWRRQAKANGLSPHDLLARPISEGPAG